MAFTPLWSEEPTAQRSHRAFSIGALVAAVAAPATPAHHARVEMSGGNFDALAADLDGAIAELVGAAGQDPTRWERGRPGHWTVGQHVAHVGITLRRTADDFEKAEKALRAGTLPAPGKRALLHRLFLAVVDGGGFMPRGLKTADWALAPGRPDRTATLEDARRGAERHLVLGRRLDAGERDRLWIVNPFRTQWHYRLPEMVRVHAVHARHHAKQVAEIVAAR